MSHTHPTSVLHPLATRERLGDVLAWLPLAALVVLVLAHLIGVPLEGTALALNPESVVVTGTVDKDVQFDTSACPAGALTLGQLVPDDPWKNTPADCTLSFGSNNSSAGADLTVQEDALAGAGDAMKCVAGCSADTISDIPGPLAASPAAPASAFGIRLMSTAGAAAGVWGLAPALHPVADAPSTACQTASSASGSCSFRWGGMTASGADIPGSYQAQTQFTVIAR